MEFQSSKGVPHSSQNQKHLQITIWWWDEHACFGFPKHRFFANLNLLGWLNGTKKRRITQGFESTTWETLEGRSTRSCPYPFCLHAIRKCHLNIQPRVGEIKLLTYHCFQVFVWSLKSQCTMVKLKNRVKSSQQLFLHQFSKEIYQTLRDDE